MSSSWIDLARGCEFVSAALADELHLAGRKVREISFSEPYTVQALSTHTLNATLSTGAVLEMQFTTRELIAAGDEGPGKAEAVGRIRDFVAGLSRH